MIQLTKIVGKYPRHCVEADDLADAAAWLRVTPRRWKSNTAEATDRIHGGSSWDFGAGWHGALELARDGWSAGAQDLHGRLAVAAPPLRDTSAKWRYDVAGERPDIGRYLGGDPANMMRHGHPKGHKPVITIVVSVWIAACIRAQQMANFGAAMVQIIDQLEQQSHRVEVKAGVIAVNFHRTAMMSALWGVKRADEPVDLAALAFSLGHPAASRRIGWAMWERSDAPDDSLYGYGLGPVPSTDDLIDPAPHTYVIPGLRAESRCNTLDDAIKFAAEQINKAAGETIVEVE